MSFPRLDEGFKSSSYLTEALFDPEFGHASDSNKAAFNKAYNTDKEIWHWWELPENGLRIARFGAGMGSVSRMSPPEALLDGSVMLRISADHNLTSRFPNGRVRLGKSPAGLDSCRCWRRRRRAVVNARYSSPAASLRCPRPRICCTGRCCCTCLEPADLSEYCMCLKTYWPQFWKNNLPGAIESSRVKLQGL